MAHIAALPSSDNGWASWFCEDCNQNCASDNLCDCCND
jgi:hypothetical protein